jgi:catechol 2,3-dioxygenase-like lactoylglutathione lyase family enzyme
MTRLFAVVIDAVDHIALARWWASALRVPVAGEEPHEAWIDLERSPQLVFVPVAEPKVGKNRIHLDLATSSMVDYVGLVARLIDKGARHVDVGQTRGGWVVLADPEGNELCVLEPRPAKGYDGPVAAIVFDTGELEATVDFWVTASGWEVLGRDETWAELRHPSGAGPYLAFGRGDEPKAAKNRVHLDVAPAAGEDHDAAVAALVEAGATPRDIGQGDTSWVVLADPGGNELCVLTPR